jgi:hypothetical protein
VAQRILTVVHEAPQAYIIQLRPLLRAMYLWVPHRYFVDQPPGAGSRQLFAEGAEGELTIANPRDEG